MDIVSYALKVGVNCVTCVSIVHFRSSGTFESLYAGLTVNIHVTLCPPKRVTGNNLFLHKALAPSTIDPTN